MLVSHGPGAGGALKDERERVGGGGEGGGGGGEGGGGGGLTERFQPAANWHFLRVMCISASVFSYISPPN